jgi:hypothetical protein
MQVEGNIEYVKKDILQNGGKGKGGDTRPVLLLLGGVMRGVSGAAVLQL